MYKKVIAFVIASFISAFTLCIPSFATSEGTHSGTGVHRNDYYDIVDNGYSIDTTELKKIYPSLCSSGKKFSLQFDSKDDLKFYCIIAFEKNSENALVPLIVGEFGQFRSMSITLGFSSVSLSRAELYPVEASIEIVNENELKTSVICKGENIALPPSSKTDFNNLIELFYIELDDLVHYNEFVDEFYGKTKDIKFDIKQDVSIYPNSKFLNLGSYKNITPQSFKQWVSTDSIEKVTNYNDKGDLLESYTYLNSEVSALRGYPFMNDGCVQTAGTELIIQIQTPKVVSSYYLTIDKVYEDSRQNKLLWVIPIGIDYFNTYIEDYAILTPTSMCDLKPNSTYVFKMDLSGFIPLNYMSSYCISVRRNSGECLDSVSYIYAGSTQESNASNSKISVSSSSLDGYIDKIGDYTYNPDGVLIDNSGLEYTPDNSLDGYNKNALSIENYLTDFKAFASGATSFFQACYGIMPASIMTIIIGGIALVVILRVLGR